MNRFFRLPFAALTIALTLAGCNSGEPSLPGEAASASQTGDAEDRRAARSLSIGNAPALDDDVGSYIQALRCSIALETINERFINSGDFSAELKRGMLDAQAIYERQVAQLGAEDGKSRKEIQGDIEAQAKQIPEISTRGQIVIGCLRKLAGEGS